MIEVVKEDKTNSPGLTFTKYYNEIITLTIEFKEEWRQNADGDTYYGNVAKLVNLDPGMVVKCLDIINNRRIILVGTRFGTIAVYDKYGGQTTFGVFNASFRRDIPTMKALISGYIVGESEMSKIIGHMFDITKNIGNKIEEMSADFQLLNLKD